MSDKDDVREQIKRMQKAFSDKAKGVRWAVKANVAKACLLVEVDCKIGMTETQVDTSISYGKHGHHPSVPGAYPAVDLGLLRMSVTHDIDVVGGAARGRVGSTIVDPPYGLFLEHGTSRMAPRPWLGPSMLKNAEKIKELLASSLASKKEGDDAGE